MGGWVNVYVDQVKESIWAKTNLGKQGSFTSDIDPGLYCFGCMNSCVPWQGGRGGMGIEEKVKGGWMLWQLSAHRISKQAVRNNITNSNLLKNKCTM